MSPVNNFARSSFATKWREGTAPAFPVLVPLVDCANHRRDARVSWDVTRVNGGDRFIFATHDRLGPDQQVFNNYGPKGVEERK